LARRKHCVFLKHYLAMQLLLGVEDQTGAYPNIAYVKKHPAALPVMDIPIDDLGDPKNPSAAPDPDLRFKFLRDMFLLVDENVYSTFHTMLKTSVSVGLGSQAIDVNEELMQLAVKHNSRILQRTSDQVNAEIRYPMGVRMWACNPPHPSPYVLREVVADLLA
jgi:hypothetical protein